MTGTAKKHTSACTNGKLKVEQNPYGENTPLFQMNEIAFEPGITILTGTNGSGKTSLLHDIYSRLYEMHVPVYTRFNLAHDKSSLENALFNGDADTLMQLMTLSEGETIKFRMGEATGELGKFMNDGVIAASWESKMVSQIVYGKEIIKNESQERWILLDESDSGLSIDNLHDLKEFLRFLVTKGEKQNLTVYILISANTYELARGENCMDVRTGTRMRFETYEDYRDYIFESRKHKAERY